MKLQLLNRVENILTKENNTLLKEREEYLRLSQCCQMSSAAACQEENGYEGNICMVICIGMSFIMIVYNIMQITLTFTM